jgi:transcription initiation factor TFIIH subunit 4
MIIEQVVEILNSLGKTPQPHLLNDPVCACMLVRLLPPIIRTVIIKFLIVAGPVPFSFFIKDLSHLDKTDRNSLLRLVKQIGILQGKAKEVWINPEFQKVVLASPPLLILTAHPFFKSVKQLAKPQIVSTIGNWEKMLLSMVRRTLDEDFQNLFLHAALVNAEKAVTSKGFQFLMSPRTNQLWTVLLAITKPQDYHILLKLANCRGGIYYNKSSIDSQLFFWLVKLGLIVEEEDRTLFTITDLVGILLPHEIVSYVNQPKQSSEEEGFIILETNYSLYAYTDNLLHIALLSLFIQLTDRFPHFVFGRLTPESIHGALEAGISATQIIGYLHIHAHPQCRERYGTECSVPPNLADTIRLWEMERQRTLNFKGGVLWSGFLDEGEWGPVVAEAERIGAKMYANLAKRMLVVDPAANSYLKSIYSSLSKK